MAPDDPIRAVGLTVKKRLQQADGYEDRMEVVREATYNIDRAFDAIPSRLKATVACRAGCSFCCSVPVGVQAHEVLIAAAHIKERFSEERLRAVLERLRRHREVVARPDHARADLFHPCGLLDDNRCSIYRARPEACRSHHACDATLCKKDIETPGSDAAEKYIPAIRGRLFPIMLGIDQGVVEAGFDGRAYDFGAALHEALTNEECAEKWERGEQTFPDECRESIPPGETEAGDFERGIL